MTAINKAKIKLEELQASLPNLSKKVAETVEAGIPALSEIIDLFTRRKHKTDRAGLKDLYAWFEDEFNVRYELVTVKVTD